MIEWDNQNSVEVGTYPFKMTYGCNQFEDCVYTDVYTYKIVYDDVNGNDEFKIDGIQETGTIKKINNSLYVYFCYRINFDICLLASEIHYYNYRFYIPSKSIDCYIFNSKNLNYFDNFFSNNSFDKEFYSQFDNVTIDEENEIVLFNTYDRHHKKNLEVKVDFKNKDFFIKTDAGFESVKDAKK